MNTHYCFINNFSVIGIKGFKLWKYSIGCESRIGLWIENYFLQIY